MSKTSIKDAGIVDAHLDYMIQLAFMYEDVLMANEAEEATHREYTKEEKEIFRDTFTLAKKKYEQMSKQQSRKALRTKVKKDINKVINIAAALLLIFVLIAPLAIAKVEFIRVRVMKLLIEIQDDRTDIRMQEDDEASFNVPAEWQGEYYPSYIPRGYKVYSIFPLYNTAEYIDEDSHHISYIEYTEGTEIAVDSEDAKVSDGEVNGNRAIIVHKNNWLIIWTNGDRYFTVTADDYDEAMDVAKGIRKID